MDLKVAREKKGLTQQQLAELSGVGQSSIVRLEKGEGNPVLSTVLALEAALGVKRGQLTFGEVTA